MTFWAILFPVLASPFISSFTHFHFQGSPAEGTGKFDAGPGKHAILSESPVSFKFLEGTLACPAFIYSYIGMNET